MAILHRYGNADQFDPYKMRPSEFAHVRVGNSTYKAGFYACYAAGDVRYLITNQDMAELLNASADSYTALQQLISDLNTNPSEITNILSNISVLQSGKLDKTGDSQNNTVTFTEAVTLANVATAESHSTLWSKVMKFFSFIGTTALTTTAQTITGAINELVSGRIKTADIVQTDTTNSSTKVPSSAVTYAMGAEIDTHTGQITTINNNLVKVAVLYLNQEVTANTDTIFEFNISAYANVLDVSGQITGTGTNADVSIIRLYGYSNKFVIRSSVTQTVFVKCTVLYK